MNKTILIVVIVVLVIAVLGYMMMKNSSNMTTGYVSPQPSSGTSTTYQNNGTAPMVSPTGTTGTTASAPTDLSNTSLDNSLQSIDNQAAGANPNSDNLNF